MSFKMLSGMIISRLIDREGCAHKHFVEAKLLFNLHKIKTYAQCASAFKLYKTNLEGMACIWATLNLHAGV